MLVEDCPTLADHLVGELFEVITDHGTPAKTPRPKTNDKQLQQLELAESWYWTIMYYSRQGSTVVPTLTDETQLQNLIIETASIQLSYSVGAGQSGASRLILDLIEVCSIRQT